MNCLWLILPYPWQFLISKEIGISKTMVIDWSSFCREVCIFWLSKESQVLGGPGVVVEINEAKFGKRKYNRGRWLDGQWVFCGFERGSKIVFLFPFPAADQTCFWSSLKNGFTQVQPLFQTAGERATAFPSYMKALTTPKIS